MQFMPNVSTLQLKGLLWCMHGRSTVVIIRTLLHIPPRGYEHHDIFIILRWPFNCCQGFGGTVQFHRSRPVMLHAS